MAAPRAASGWRRSSGTKTGTWYGYYHNEVPAVMCRNAQKVVPRIGAARSTDRGATWEPLGLILEAPPRTYDCRTDNSYFVGGVGDFSVMLDPESRDVYFYYSLYLRSQGQQGVGVARLAWADRDQPTGKILSGGNWYPQVIGTEAGSGTDKVAGEWAWVYMMGTSQHFIRFTR